MKEKSSELVLESSLQSFFYDRLREINQKSNPPIFEEAIFYSSTVLDKYGDSSKYFENVDGKIREKILGAKFLEAHLMNKAMKKRELKDIGDTALFLCGFFSDSLNRKIVDTRYYQDIGRMAYQRLNQLIPDELQIPSFYGHLSNSFDTLSNMIGIVAHQVFEGQKDNDHMILFVSQKPKKAC